MGNGSFTLEGEKVVESPHSVLKTTLAGLGDWLLIRLGLPGHWRDQQVRSHSIWACFLVPGNNRGVGFVARELGHVILRGRVQTCMNT